MIMSNSDNDGGKAREGRPEVITEFEVTKLEEAFRNDATVKRACSYANVNPRTYYRKHASDKEFCRRMSVAQDYPHLLADTASIIGLKKGDYKYALEWKKLRDDRYQPKQTVSVEPAKELINFIYGGNETDKHSKAMEPSKVSTPPSATENTREPS